MSSTLRRLRHDERGGTMAEYGLALAAVSGVEWLERTTRTLVDDPMMLLGAAVAAALLLGWLARPAR